MMNTGTSTKASPLFIIFPIVLPAWPFLSPVWGCWVWRCLRQNSEPRNLASARYWGQRWGRCLPCFQRIFYSWCWLPFYWLLRLPGGLCICGCRILHIISGWNGGCFCWRGLVLFVCPVFSVGLLGCK